METETGNGLGLGAPLCSAVLRLTLKRKWFDMIASGEKREEYRTPKRWILSRLEGKEYGSVEFRNGYGKGAPVVTLEYLGWSFGYGQPEWGGCSTPGNPLVVIKLGKVLLPPNVSDDRHLPAAELDLGRLINSLPPDVNKKLSLHDLKRICDIYNTGPCPDWKGRIMQQIEVANREYISAINAYHNAEEDGVSSFLEHNLASYWKGRRDALRVFVPNAKGHGRLPVAGAQQSNTASNG